MSRARSPRQPISTRWRTCARHCARAWRPRRCSTRPAWPARWKRAYRDLWDEWREGAVPRLHRLYAGGDRRGRDRAGQPTARPRSGAPRGAARARRLRLRRRRSCHRRRAAVARTGTGGHPVRPWRDAARAGQPRSGGANAATGAGARSGPGAGAGQSRQRAAGPGARRGGGSRAVPGAGTRARPAVAAAQPGARAAGPAGRGRRRAAAAAGPGPGAGRSPRRTRRSARCCRKAAGRSRQSITIAPRCLG